MGTPAAAVTERLRRKNWGEQLWGKRDEEEARAMVGKDVDLAIMATVFEEVQAES